MRIHTRTHTPATRMRIHTPATRMRIQLARLTCVLVLAQLTRFSHATSCYHPTNKTISSHLPRHSLIQAFGPSHGVRASKRSVRPMAFAHPSSRSVPWRSCIQAFGPSHGVRSSKRSVRPSVSRQRRSLVRSASNSSRVPRVSPPSVDRRYTYPLSTSRLKWSMKLQLFWDGLADVGRRRPSVQSRHGEGRDPT